MILTVYLWLFLKLSCGFFCSRPKRTNQVSNCLDAVIDDFVDENVYDIDESTTKIPQITPGQQSDKNIWILLKTNIYIPTLEIWRNHLSQRNSLLGHICKQSPNV